MEIRRGDLALAALPGDYGKLRPVVVLRDDAFEAVPSVTVLPLTSDLINFPLVRIEVHPTSANGLQRPSQIMVDKIGTVRREKIGRRIGRLEVAEMRAAVDALSKFLGMSVN
jgi:mRNA interferase MazF